MYMKSNLVLWLGLLWCVTAPFCTEAQDVDTPPASARESALIGIAKSGTPGKLSFELKGLARQFARTRAERFVVYSEQQLQNQFGIKPGDRQAGLDVAIQVNGSFDTSELKPLGAQMRARVGDVVYAQVPAARLGDLAKLTSVESVETMPAVRLPPKPKLKGPATLSRPRGDEPGQFNERFDRQGLTGKGVIVAVIDTGIDWRHEDFIRADGKTRILFLYDPYDDSFAESKGKVGSAPPYLNLDGSPVGTLYTSEQINTALSGSGEVNSRDTVGHGTACAGTAAGNGRAAGNGVLPGTYQGVAPEAEFIVVKGLGGSGPCPIKPTVSVEWVFKKAKELGRPCVVNMSYGGHYTAHDGTDAGEKLLDGLLGAGKPGQVAVVSAGNEGDENMHAFGRFGPPGQPDNYGRWIELFVSEYTEVNAYFRGKDDWGLNILGKDNFLVTEEGKGVQGYVYRSGGKLGSLAWHAGAVYSGGVAKEWGGPKGSTAPKNFAEYWDEYVGVTRLKNGYDHVELMLPPGKYLIRGYGEGENVADGRFDLYLPESTAAHFGRGVAFSELVGSPGNSANVITVGSYDFRNRWVNLKGTTTAYNLPLGQLSDYSSPGFRLDGLVKPEISAPAQYAISSLAKDCEMGEDSKGALDGVMVTQDGKHLAWRGTSAAAPYIAGVIALMLEKNPTLDTAQVKKLLVETAKSDAQTGAVPNRQWGNGKVDPATALTKTPAAGGLSLQSLKIAK